MTLLNPDPKQDDLRSQDDQRSQDDRQSEDSLFGDMVRVPGGTFRMGSDRHYPEEAPVHRVTVDGFWIDRTPVTNRQFKAFIKATGHTTFADAPKACCVPENPRGGREEASHDPRQPDIKIPRKVIKGGSHLCAPNYSAATGRRRAMRKRSIPRRAISDSDA